MRMNANSIYMCTVSVKLYILCTKRRTQRLCFDNRPTDSYFSPLSLHQKGLKIPKG